MPYYISGTVTDLGLVAARPVVALKGDHANDVELGSFLGRNVSGDDGIYVLAIGNYPQKVIVVGLDIAAAPRSQPDALDWKDPVLIPDHLTEVLADSPAGFWRLFETAGGVAADSSGNITDGNYIGAAPGSPSITASGEGYSAYFDYNAGSPVSRVEVPSVLATTTNPDFSFECWYQSSVTTRQMNLWDRRSTGSPTRRLAIVLHRQGGSYGEGYVSVFFQGPNANTRTISTAHANSRLTDGQSHHLMVTKVGAVVSIYFDGAWQQVDGTVDIPGPFHNGQNHYMGCDADFLSATKFEGYMSEVAFFPAEVPAPRVINHFSSSF